MLNKQKIEIVGLQVECLSVSRTLDSLLIELKEALKDYAKNNPLAREIICETSTRGRRLNNLHNATLELTEGFESLPEDMKVVLYHLGVTLGQSRLNNIHGLHEAVKKNDLAAIKESIRDSNLQEEVKIALDRRLNRR